MKQGFHKERIFFPLMVLLGIFANANFAMAWNQSFHALVAEKAMGLEHRYIASYNARVGSLVPDFFWYLRYKGLIDPVLAGQLHGETSTDRVLPETTPFYHTASDLVEPWNFGLRYFTKGMAKHLYADIKAHDPAEGYVEGRDGWIISLAELTGLNEKKHRESLHLALEFAVDAMLISKYGFQIQDLLFTKTQADFVQKAVVQALDYTPDFDVSREFEAYLGLMRAVEGLAALYAPFLNKHKVKETVQTPLTALQEPGLEISEEAADILYDAFLILLFYPSEIRMTITADGMHWEEDALEAVIDFCRDPAFGP